MYWYICVILNEIFSKYKPIPMSMNKIYFRIKSTVKFNRKLTGTEKRITNLINVYVRNT